MMHARTGLLLVVALAALSGPAFAREKKGKGKAEGRGKYSVAAIRGVDGKTIIEAIPAAKVAERAAQLEADYKAAVRANENPAKPALIELCKDLQGKRKATAVLKAFQRQLDKAAGQPGEPDQQKPKRGRKKKKKDQEGGAGGGEPPADGEGNF